MKGTRQRRTDLRGATLYAVPGKDHIIISSLWRWCSTLAVVALCVLVQACERMKGWRHTLQAGDFLQIFCQLSSGGKWAKWYAWKLFWQWKSKILRSEIEKMHYLCVIL